MQFQGLRRAHSGAQSATDTFFRVQYRAGEEQLFHGLPYSRGQGEPPTADDPRRIRLYQDIAAAFRNRPQLLIQLASNMMKKKAT